jgi:hypothetical protein
MDKGPFWIRRIGRRVLWPHPQLYRLIGAIRKRGNGTETNFDLWVDGFPRSATTFTAKLFQLANPGAHLRQHTHLPPFIIKAVRANKPGMFLLRKPEDAVISWAIFWRMPLKPCLDYYLDFHRALLPYSAQLFVARFELVTVDFPRVIAQFNERFGTQYALPPQGVDSVSACFSMIEDDFKNPAGEVDELIVCRPSPRRREIKAGMLKELRESRVLSKKIAEAEKLHAAFVGQSGLEEASPVGLQKPAELV